MTTVIGFSGVSKIFTSSRRSSLVALDGLSFTVEQGEFVSILGRSGCGKSTTVALSLGLEAPTTGTVEVLGLDPRRASTALRNRVACIFQNDRLLPWRSAVANVMLPLEVAGISKVQQRERASLWLERFGLADFADSFPHELSGGMRQRVAIARALVAEPEVILADEAFASLDAITGRELRGEFHRNAKENSKTVLAITHSIDEALDFSDRVIVLSKPGHTILELTDVASASRLQRTELHRQVTAALVAGEALTIAAE